jgi:hypothetical protein
MTAATTIDTLSCSFEHPKLMRRLQPFSNATHSSRMLLPLALGWEWRSNGSAAACVTAARSSSHSVGNFLYYPGVSQNAPVAACSLQLYGRATVFVRLPYVQ